MNIDRIRVEDRHRADLGDLSDLKASISVHGLLHPVVVTEDGRLIAGQRRLEVCKALGWTDVPATVITDVSGAAALLEMERDENVCRKDMAPTEKLALGRALEELERPKAKEAMVEAGRVGAAMTNDPGSVHMNKPRERVSTRKTVAEAVGLSEPAYARAKELVTAAETGDIAAQLAVEEMDKTGKIHGPHREWKDRQPVAPVNQSVRREQRIALIEKLAAEGYTSAQMVEKVGVTEQHIRQTARDFDIEILADRVTQHRPRIDSNRVAAETANALAGLAIGVQLVNYEDLDQTEIDQWAISLADSLRVLNRFLTNLKKEMTHA